MKLMEGINSEQVPLDEDSSSYPLNHLEDVFMIVAFLCSLVRLFAGVIA